MPRAVKITKREPSETITENFQRRPLHALHIEELNNIWEADRRIPSVPSRRAWAEARNLNPTNVHNWWYRRRPLARKLKLKIPREEYEVDVGTPPVIPEIEEVNAVEVSTEMLPSSESSDVGSEVSSPLLCLSGAKTSTSVTHALDQCALTENPLFEELSVEMSAYIRSSSPDFSWLVPSSTSRHSTSSRDSLPPSSPPASTPPPCVLTFPEDMVVEDDTIAPSKRFLDSILTEHMETCSSTSYVPHSFSDRLNRIEASDITSSDHVSLPLFPSWCLGGCRVSCDGSFLGFCSCFTFTDDKSADYVNC